MRAGQRGGRATEGWGRGGEEHELGISSNPVKWNREFIMHHCHSVGKQEDEERHE